MPIMPSFRPLYGKHEGAVTIRTNPGSFPTPITVYRTANPQLVLDAEALSKNKTAACYSTPGLSQLPERLLAAFGLPFCSRIQAEAQTAS